LELNTEIPHGLVWTGKALLNDRYTQESLIGFSEVRNLADSIARTSIYVFWGFAFYFYFGLFRIFKISTRRYYRSGLIVIFVITFINFIMSIGSVIDMKMYITPILIIHLIIQIIYLVCIYRLFLNYLNVNKYEDFIERKSTI